MYVEELVIHLTVQHTYNARRGRVQKCFHPNLACLPALYRRVAERTFVKYDVEYGTCRNDKIDTDLQTYTLKSVLIGERPKGGAVAYQHPTEETDLRILEDSLKSF